MEEKYLKDTELCNTHMEIIMQDSYKNSVSNTVVVIPISSSTKVCDTHEKISEKDLKEDKADLRIKFKALLFIFYINFNVFLTKNY